MESQRRTKVDLRPFRRGELEAAKRRRKAEVGRRKTVCCCTGWDEEVVGILRGWDRRLRRRKRTRLWSDLIDELGIRMRKLDVAGGLGCEGRVRG